MILVGKLDVAGGLEGQMRLVFGLGLLVQSFARLS
jgi:hypothetical protein